MSLIINIREYIGQPGKNIAVITIDDVRSSYDELREFIQDIQQYLGEEWSTGVQRRETDDGDGKRIVLAMYPNMIQEHRVSGERIYIIEKADELSHALTFHHIKP